MRYFLSIVFLSIVFLLSYWSFTYDVQIVDLVIGNWQIEISLVLFVLLLFFICWVLIFVWYFFVFLVKTPFRAKARLSYLSQRKRLNQLKEVNFLISQQCWDATVDRLTQISATSHPSEVLLFLNIIEFLLPAKRFDALDLCLLKCKVKAGDVHWELFVLKKAEVLLEKDRIDQAVKQLALLNQQELSGLLHDQFFIVSIKIHLAQKSYDKVFELVRHLVDQAPLIRPAYKCIIESVVLCLYQVRYFNHIDSAISFWETLPRDIRYVDKVFLSLINYLDQPFDIDGLYLAEALLRKAIQNDWKEKWIVRFVNLKIHMNETHLKQLTDWLRYEPDNLLLLTSIARVALRINHLDIAYQYLKKCLSIRSDHQLACYLMSIYYEKKAQYRQALIYRRRFDTTQIDSIYLIGGV